MRPTRTLLATVVAGLLAITACGGGGDPLATNSTEPAGRDTITVGSANFPENVILAEIYAQALEAQGAQVSTKLNIGSREKYYPALEQGSLDLFPEYTGATLSYLEKDTEASSPEDVEALVMPEQTTVKATRNVTKWMPNALCVYSAAPAAWGYLVTSSR